MSTKRTIALGVITVLILGAAIFVGSNDELIEDLAPDASGTDVPTEEAAVSVPTSGPSGYEYPGPKAPIPKGAVGLAEELNALRPALEDDIAIWMTEDTKRNDTAKAIALGGLRDQRLSRYVNAHDRVRRKVLKLLEPRIASILKRNYKAGHALSVLTTPVEKVPDWRIFTPEPPHNLMRYYLKAQKRFGVKWYYLAAVNLVESRMGRLKGPSSAGARGPMQFMPATWDAYGNGGNVNDPHDAILGAGRYLHASGAPGDMKSALYSYNHSSNYVTAIQTYAREMKAHRKSFFVYYYWQVFVRTTKGDVQMTGPGT